MEIQLDFISVNDKLPIDDWRKEIWFDEEENHIFETFFGIVENDDPNEEPEICIVCYLSDKGFVYNYDMSTKYDGNPWRVTWWAKMPRLTNEIIGEKCKKH
jgi:hypothetical protein